jgi:hypothetical protein
MRYGVALLSSAFLAGLASASLAQEAPASPPAQAQIQATEALAALEDGNNWIGTNKQKQAVALDPSIENRFNLAVGYQRTGRLAQAKTYYEDLTRDGLGAEMRATNSNRAFNVADESASRLAYIDWRTNGAARASGAVSADAASSNVSATVGGDYEVTDAQARALDRRARK